MELLLAFLCGALLLCLHGFLFARLLPPAQKAPLFAVIRAQGDGEGLEQTLRHLHWLHREKLSHVPVLVLDAGLIPEGRRIAAALQRKDPALLFCTAEEATLIFKRKDDHGYFSP